MAKSKIRPKVKSKVKTKTKSNAKPTKKISKKINATPAKKLGAKKVQFSPIADRVLLRQSLEDTQTSGGIIIPDSAREKNQRGTIVAVGPGHKNKKGQLRPLMVKPGDNVLFDKYAGTKIEVDGSDYLIIRESELIGVID